MHGTNTVVYILSTDFGRQTDMQSDRQARKGLQVFIDKLRGRYGIFKAQNDRRINTKQSHEGGKVWLDDSSERTLMDQASILKPLAIPISLNFL